MSTVTLSLSEVVTLTTEEEPSFTQRISTAFTDSRQVFFEICQGLIVAAVYLIPFLGIPAIATLIIISASTKRKNNEK